MVTFCIMYIGNRKYFYNIIPPPPKSQLILLHVIVFSHFTFNICEKLVGTRGNHIPQPKM